MIYNDVLGEDRREYHPSREPVLIDIDAEDYGFLDPAIENLKRVMINPTPQNCEYAFWNDSISQSFSYITSSIIIGDGLRIRCENKEAKTLIKEFNKEINVERQSIEDFITHSWIDNQIHQKGSLWRILKNDKFKFNLDVQRLDPKTLKKIKDKSYGWVKYVQEVPNYKEYRSKISFYRNAEKRDQLPTTYGARTKDVHIPDEPDTLLRTNFFVKSPIASALHYITYKRWILYFMRKYAQKHWAPFLLAFIGDPKTNFYPSGPHKMKKQMEQVNSILPKITNFGGCALPGNVKVETLDTGTARSAEIYTHYMNELDKQIMMSIFGSMGLREASGQEKSTQQSLRIQLLQFLKGIRRKYELALERFYAYGLCRVNDIRISPNDIDIDWSPLRFEDSKSVMESVRIGVETGMFSSRNEIREAGQMLFSWLDPLDTDEEISFDDAMRGIYNLGGAENNAVEQNPNVAV